VRTEAVFDLAEQLREEGIILSYSGYVSEAILFALGEALKLRMSARDADALLVKRLFSIFVEQVQNIIRYSQERTAGPPPLGAGIVLVGEEDGSFFVICGNIVPADRIDRLRSRLDAIAAMDKDDLRRFYREKLREAPEEESQGATLGLIEIARRASLPPSYDVVALDEERSFFCLKAFV